ncbi:MAG: PilZ domain-containing protein [Mariprofundaceae bacterium]
MQNNERRDNSRTSSSLKVKICCINQNGNDIFEHTTLRDLSDNGLCFHTKSVGNYDFGQAIEISALSPVHNKKGLVEIGNGRVMWVNEEILGSSSWVGIMLDNLLNMDQLHNLLNSSD